MNFMLSWQEQNLTREHIQSRTRSLANIKFISSRNRVISRISSTYLPKTRGPGIFEDKTYYIEDITRWREDMNFMFEWQEQYLTRSLRSLVRYSSCHENIKFISSSQRVMFFLLYGETNSTKAKGGNRDAIEDTTLTKVTYGKYATRVPDEVVYWIYEWFSSQ